MLAFITAALTITGLMFGLSLVVVLAQEQVVDALQASAVKIKRWGGGILVLVGIWLIILAIWADAFARLFPV